MTKSLSVSALLLSLLLLPSPASAQLSEVYQAWGSGPASYLMLPNEEAAWKQITNDQDAEEFIRLFWAQRDPSVGTELNEFRRELEQRVAYADQRFATKETAGAMTDRGRVFVLLGPPRRIQTPGASGSATGGDFGTGDSPFDTSGSVSSGTGPGAFGRGGATERSGVASEERWIYEDDYVPSFIDRKRFTVRFLSKPGTEEVELRDGERVLAYMAEARQLARAHPELTAADLSTGGGGGLSGDSDLMAWMGDELSGASASLTALREALGNGGGGGATHLDAGAFQAGDGRWIIPYQISAEADPAGDPAEVVGELVKADGDPVLSFHLEQSWRKAQGQSYVKDTLVVPPGDYVLRTGLEQGGKVSWAASEPVSVPTPAEDFWLSELLFSNSVFPMQEAQQMLEPYAWQGIAVVPKGNRTFLSGSVMWFYLHACYATLTADGEPSLRVNVKIKGPESFRGPVPVQPARAGDNCWVIAQGLDLTPDRFPPGDYDMNVQVRDSEAQITLSTEGKFSVAPKS